MFRFEAGWIQEDNCRMIVQNAWNLTVEARSGSVVEAIWEVGAELWDRSRNILGDLEKRIKRVKRDLEACRRRSIDAQSVGREAILKYKLEKLENQKEELMHTSCRREIETQSFSMGMPQKGEGEIELENW